LWKGIITIENFRALMILYSEIGGACVDTIFGYISSDAYMGLVKYRSADEATVTSLHGSCR